MSMLLKRMDPFKEFRELEQRFQGLFPSIEKADANLAGFSP